MSPSETGLPLVLAEKRHPPPGVAIGPLGRNAEGSGSLSSKGKLAAMYSYSKTKGLFGGEPVAIRFLSCSARSLRTWAPLRRLPGRLHDRREIRLQPPGVRIQRHREATTWVDAGSSSPSIIRCAALRCTALTPDPSFSRTLSQSAARSNRRNLPTR